MASVTKCEGKKGITYRIRVSNGYDARGKQIIKNKRWCPKPNMTEKQIKKELNKVVLDFEQKVEGDQVFGNMKFELFSEKWLQDYLYNQGSPKYILEAKRMLKEVNREIGHIPLSKIKKAHLQEFYEKLLAGVRITEKNLPQADGSVKIVTTEHKKSASIIHHYHRLISTILTKAVQWDYIDRNICLGKGLELPKVKRKDPQILQDTDLTCLVKCLENESLEYKAIILTLLYTGMRIGEVLGLEWGDIDFKNNTISIKRCSQYLEGKGVITKSTKNLSSERVIPVVQDLIVLLSRYKLVQNEQRLKMGKNWKANPKNTAEKHCDNWFYCTKNMTSCYCIDYNNCKKYIDSERVFTQFNGVPMHPKTPYQWLKKFIEREGLPNFTIHSLRHTNISLMIMQGVPITSVASLVGHSSPVTTAKIYAHSIQTAEQIATEKVANVINPERLRL